ncbi:CLUMA_CG014822, isoform A [Clunio marinus]|uniref:CLUMA_CG014822, isoform A n=1 Tax=Clunio marinus TaxID=568069 RepID=A0A1J1IM17_9DIPT|nr:CLUMA_CG014822, isoform A [Clunio marinus]
MKIVKKIFMSQVVQQNAVSIHSSGNQFNCELQKKQESQHREEERQISFSSNDKVHKCLINKVYQ